MQSAFTSTESQSKESTIDAGSGTLLQGVLAWAVAVGALGGGIIHLEASLDHRDLVVVATGFAAMAISQWLVAAAVLLRPSRVALMAGGALHLGILIVWILSRTVGLPFIPGAESPAEFGVADVVANAFSIVVTAAAVIGIALGRRSATSALSTNLGRAIRATMVVVALSLTVVAVGAPHVHAGHDEPASASESGVGQATNSHDHEHEHPAP